MGGPQCLLCFPSLFSPCAPRSGQTSATPKATTEVLCVGWVGAMQFLCPCPGLRSPDRPGPIVARHSRGKEARPEDAALPISPAQGRGALPDSQWPTDQCSWLFQAQALRTYWVFEGGHVAGGRVQRGHARVLGTNASSRAQRARVRTLTHRHTGRSSSSWSAQLGKEKVPDHPKSLATGSRHNSECLRELGVGRVPGSSRAGPCQSCSEG